MVPWLISCNTHARKQNSTIKYNKSISNCNTNNSISKITQWINHLLSLNRVPNEICMTTREIKPNWTKRRRSKNWSILRWHRTTASEWLSAAGDRSRRPFRQIWPCLPSWAARAGPTGCYPRWKCAPTLRRLQPFNKWDIPRQWTRAIVHHFDIRLSTITNHSFSTIIIIDIISIFQMMIWWVEILKRRPLSLDAST